MFGLLGKRDKINSAYRVVSNGEEFRVQRVSFIGLDWEPSWNFVSTERYTTKIGAEDAIRRLEEQDRINTWTPV